VTHKPESISVALRTVPQALTIEHYDTLIDFALQHELNVDANLLIHPPELALSVLPLEVKLQLAEHFESKYKSLLSLCVSPMEVSDFRNHHHHRRQIAHHVQSLVELLTATEVQQIEELRCNFVDYNKKFDRATGQNFAESYPNLIKFYEKYHNSCSL
jgi:cation transport regulator ChaB